ncbi:MAG: oxidoreductase-like domain-containing protein [Oxalobacteraceae bacterium]
MNKPTMPVDGECCESGCDPCVWDTYYAALRAWEAQQAALAQPAVNNFNAPTLVRHE